MAIKVQRIVTVQSKVEDHTLSGAKAERGYFF